MSPRRTTGWNRCERVSESDLVHFESLGSAHQRTRTLPSGLTIPHSQLDLDPLCGVGLPFANESPGNPLKGHQRGRLCSSRRCACHFPLFLGFFGPSLPSNANYESPVSNVAPNKPESQKAVLVPRALLSKTRAKPVSAKPTRPAVPTPTSTTSSPSNKNVPSKDNVVDSTSPIQPQDMSVKVASDDLVSLHTIPDLYDPLTPNSYYELFYKPKMEQMSREELSHAQKGEVEAPASGNPTVAAPGPQAGVLPPSMFGEKMLYKQGWKGAGFGLGKEGQGMATPLVGSEVSSALSSGTSKTLGTISPAPLRIESSRIVLLRNMVSRGQVDDTLASETASECAAFGRVLQCNIQEEIDQNRCSDEDAVRIFIQFDSTQAAAKAKSALDGRYFGGRSVRASSYSEAAFSENRYWLPVNS